MGLLYMGLLKLRNWLIALLSPILTPHSQPIPHNQPINPYSCHLRQNSKSLTKRKTPQKPCKSPKKASKDAPSLPFPETPKAYSSLTKSPFKIKSLVNLKNTSSPFSHLLQHGQLIYLVYLLSILTQQHLNQNLLKFPHWMIFALV